MRYKSHNNLLRYFIEPHHQLPGTYLASCKKLLHTPGKRVKNRFNRKV